MMEHLVPVLHASSIPIDRSSYPSDLQLEDVAG
jgi:hypothetical protein